MVQLVKDETSDLLKEGQLFFAGDRDCILYCMVRNKQEAHVINGAYGVRFTDDHKSIRIPYTRRSPIPILYVGKPQIEDLNDYNAAINWFENKPR